MTTYRLEIHHKDYSSWMLMDETNNKPVEVGDINPIQDKLFHQDILDEKFVLLQRNVQLKKYRVFYCWKETKHMVGIKIAYCISVSRIIDICQFF